MLLVFYPCPQGVAGLVWSGLSACVGKLAFCSPWARTKPDTPAPTMAIRWGMVFFSLCSVILDTKVLEKWENVAGTLK